MFQGSALIWLVKNSKAMLMPFITLSELDTVLSDCVLSRDTPPCNFVSSHSQQDWLKVSLIDVNPPPRTRDF